MKTTICAISDTHGMHRKVSIPECDLLIHAGDITNVGELEQLEDFNSWVKELGIPTILTAGNHDKSIPNNPEARNLLTDCELLIDQETTFRGLKIYGSPWTPWFGGRYWVYNRKRGLSINDAWAKIPEDTDILITHGPPYGILDSVPRVPLGQGCEDLLKRVKKIKPKAHFFGHLHDNHGQKYMWGSNILFVNASTCTESLKPTNPPIVIEIDGPKSRT